MLELNRNKKTWFITGLALIVLTLIFIFLTNKEEILSGPVDKTLQTKYCKDGDSGSVEEQSKISSFVLYLESSCNSLLDIDRKRCGQFLTFNDYCMNDKTLVEYSCKG